MTSSLARDIFLLLTACLPFLNNININSVKFQRRQSGFEIVCLKSTSHQKFLSMKIEIVLNKFSLKVEECILYNSSVSQNIYSINSLWLFYNNFSLSIIIKNMSYGWVIKWWSQLLFGLFQYVKFKKIINLPFLKTVI
jgi:hypothetical protein